LQNEAKIAGKASINLTTQPSQKRVKQFCGSQNQEIVLVRPVVKQAIKYGEGQQQFSSLQLVSC
jgi:hypothetical protein